MSRSDFLKAAYCAGLEKAGFTKEAIIGRAARQAAKQLYQRGAQQAARGLGKLKWGAGLGMPAAGAGVGALASEDPGAGALTGALAGLGAYGGARLGFGRLGRLVKGHAGRATISPEAARKVLQRPEIANWARKRLLAGGLLGAGGLAGGVAAGQAVAPEPEPGLLGEGGVLGLTPERISQLQQYAPVAQQVMRDVTSRGMTPEQTIGISPEEAMYYQGGY